MSDQLSLFTPEPSSERAFGGNTYVPERDHKRLTGQLRKVFELMQDGRWRTLSEIAERANGSQAAVSARLRDLRKSMYGMHEVEREYVQDGLHRYRLKVRT